MERTCQKEDLDAFRIGEAYRPERDTIASHLIGGADKGGGSAYGGARKASEPTDSLPAALRRGFFCARVKTAKKSRADVGNRTRVLKIRVDF